MSAIIRVLIISSLTLFCVACGGGGGGGSNPPVATVPPPLTPPPPPPPPPVATACTGVDTFPGFLYTAGGTEELRLASSDGCRSELVSLVGSGPMHRTADWSAGVMVWVEGAGGTDGDVVRRMDFTVDSFGNLTLEDPVTILPRAGEEPLPGDRLIYQVGDVWGDATHNSLYITASRSYQFNSGPNAGTESREVSIYDLNTLTNVNDSPDVRTIIDESFASDGTLEFSNWLNPGDSSTLPDCFNVPYPHFVPTCNKVSAMHFNPSGTRLYFGSTLEEAYRTSDSGDWTTAMRIAIDKETVGPDLVDWIIGGPEIVYAVKFESGVETGGALPRPDTNRYALPSPEYILMGQNDGNDNPTTIFQMFLNADQCADLFAPNASGMLEAPTNLWESCKDESTFNFYTWDLPHGSYHWESPEALLKDSYQQRVRPGLYDIHRVYVSGALAGTVQLVIEHAEGADTGR